MVNVNFKKMFFCVLFIRYFFPVSLRSNTLETFGLTAICLLETHWRFVQFCILFTNFAHSRIGCGRCILIYSSTSRQFTLNIFFPAPFNREWLVVANDFLTVIGKMSWNASHYHSHWHKIANNWKMISSYGIKIQSKYMASYSDQCQVMLFSAATHHCFLSIP